MDTLVDQLAQHVCSTFGKPKSFTIPNLCGGFKIFLFSPLPGEDESNLTCAYFSNGVGEKPPTRNAPQIFIFPFRESLRGFPQGLVRSTPLLEKNPEQTTPGGWAKSKPYGYHPSWQSLGVTKIQLWGLDLGESFITHDVRRMDENLMFWVDFFVAFFVCLTYLGCPLFKGWMFFDGMGVWSC